MFMDLELHNEVNKAIYALVDEAQKEYNLNLDLIVYQADKYENTGFESIRIGLGTTYRIPKKKLHYSEEVTDIICEKYANEVLTYYETELENISYEIMVYPCNRRFAVYEVGYTGIKGKQDNAVHTKLYAKELK